VKVGKSKHYLRFGFKSSIIASFCSQQKRNSKSRALFQPSIELDLLSLLAVIINTTPFQAGVQRASNKRVII
jgi:hypothetical protein